MHKFNAPFSKLCPKCDNWCVLKFDTLEEKEIKIQFDIKIWNCKKKIITYVFSHFEQKCEHCASFLIYVTWGFRSTVWKVGMLAYSWKVFSSYHMIGLERMQMLSIVCKITIFSLLKRWSFFMSENIGAEINFCCQNLCRM